MAQFTEQHFETAVTNLKSAFADGFQFEDLATVIKEGVVFAGAFRLTNAERRALAIRLINKLIDETDTPWLPDGLTDPLFKRVVPKLVDLVADAILGKLPQNAS